MTCEPALCVQAMVWLSLLFPAQAVGREDDPTDWNRIVDEGLKLWEAEPHDRYWDSFWLSIFARLAKADTGGGSGHCLLLVVQCGTCHCVIV